MENRDARRAPQNGRRVNTASAHGKKQPSPRPVPFDQQIEPYPLQAKKQKGMQQVVLPLASPAPQPGPAPRKRGKKKARSAAKGEQAARRKATRGEMRRRRRRRQLVAVLLVLLFTAVGLTLSVTVLFKVQQYRVENLDKTMPANTGIYSEEAILAALNVPLEENMFRFSAKEKEQEMDRQLPYLETVRVRRSLPSTLVVQIEPAVEAWCLKTGESWLVLSQGLKIIKEQAEQPAGLPAIYGLELLETAPGTRLALKGEQPAASSGSAAPATSGQTDEDQGLDAPVTTDAPTTGADALMQLNTLLEELKIQKLAEGTTRIDLSQENQLYFVYENRIKVILGTFNNLAYKLEVAGTLLRNESGEFLSAADKGTLDVSYQLADGTIRPPFSPGDFSMGDEPAEPTEPPPEETPPSSEESE